jgi:hypothetical protein
MWQRRTFHEIAEELNSISERFRDAEAGRLSLHAADNREVMIETSQRGIELLRTLALAVRSEQDYGRGLRDDEIVGEQLRDTDEAVRLVRELRGIPESYGACGMTLRDALNKIAHANPALASYNVDGARHDLILSGTLGAANWVAGISLPKVIGVLRKYPDAEARQ